MLQNGREVREPGLDFLQLLLNLGPNVGGDIVQAEHHDDLVEVPDARQEGLEAVRDVELLVADEPPQDHPVQEVQVFLG